MHVLISSARPSAALVTNAGSARNGRAIDTMSASPRAMMSSATAGSLMRLVAISGIETAALQAARHPRKRRARHHRCNRRDACLVPADAAVDDRGPRRFNALRQYRDLVPGTAAFNQIEHRQPVNDDEFATHCFARA